MELGSIEGVSANGNRVTIDGSLYVVTDDTKIFVVNTKQANGTRIDLGDKSDLDEADTYLATPGDPTSERCV